MARSVYDGPLDKHMDFTDPIGEGIPASGLAVQKYIKGIDSKKIGIGYTVDDQSEHLFFADKEDMNAYKADPTKTELIVDRITLIPPYTLQITVTEPQGEYATVFYGSTGNYLRYTFVTLFRNEQEINEDINVTYTIGHGSKTTTVTQSYRAGTAVAFNMDDYLEVGANTVVIEAIGQTTGAYTLKSVSYQVVNLTLTDNNDISIIYDNSTGEAFAYFKYTVSGNGTKTMEWYLNGTRLTPTADDTITATEPGERRKFIRLGSCNQGWHSIQFRVGIEVSGEMFYSRTLYREIIVSTGNTSGLPIPVIAVDLPVEDGVLGPSDHVTIRTTQYVPYLLRFAAWNPDYTGSHTAVIAVDSTQVASIDFQDEVEVEVPITMSTDGDKTLSITIGGVTRNIDFSVAETDMNIDEITDDLELAFSADGRTNESSNKDQWTDGTHTATFSNFAWTETSGWVNGRLLIPSGASLSFDYAPLGIDPGIYGKTLEFEFQSVNVDDDDAVLCNLTNSNGVGIKITASEIIVKSSTGNVLSRHYKSEEDIRVTVVINSHTGTPESGYTFVYFNGINSMGANIGPSAYYTTSTNLSFGGTNAGILLKQVRIYDAVLSKENVLNNYILYRDSIDEMTALYDKNNLFGSGISGNFDVEKIANYLPVMIITGDIPAIEGSMDKNKQIVADIRYINRQDPTRSFVCRNAAVRGQGTTSMTYPKKNLRWYSKRLPETVLYDYQENVVSNGLYSFKEGAQAVSCWCLKTDFAESSSTHNTGVARLWNDVIKRVQINGQTVLWTEAQKAAKAKSYPYDVRTTIDGFPIMVFYHIHEEDNLVFLGKFNFNNDKSTESVFGFVLPEEIEFDNSHVECWEFLNSANELALFHTTANWNTAWSGAWEARYPDGSTDTTQLKRLADWLSGTYGADPDGDATAQAKFADWQQNKGDYFDLNKLASYYVYLMRFGAVDQTVKNAMLTTEDGNHWFFILYDNDTIFGVRNDGLLRYGPEIDRQSIDPELNIPCYAGQTSTLWNNFEMDPECMELARTLDKALYTAGLTYANVIEMFNEEQSSKWAESVYNQDAQLKYIDNPGYLGSMQGSRSDHRKWWISTRFALYDAMFMSGGYTGTHINFLAPRESGTRTFTITAGKDFYYGYGLDFTPQGSPVYLEAGESHTFTTTGEFAIGTQVKIYAPYYLSSLDISDFIEEVGAQNFELSQANSPTLGTKLKTLILGVDTDQSNKRNNALTALSGLDKCVALETLNIAGYQAIRTMDLSTLANLKVFKAKASGLRSVIFAAGSPLTRIELPSVFETLTLRNITTLQTSGVILEGNGANIQSIDIRNCPQISNSPTFLLNWINALDGDYEGRSVYMDNVNWSYISTDDLGVLTDFVDGGGTLTLRGRATTTQVNSDQALALMEAFDEPGYPTVFQEGAPFYISVPTSVLLYGPTSVVEGDTAVYQTIVLNPISTPSVTYSLSGSRTGTSIDSSTGVLTTTENGLDTSTVTVVATVDIGSGRTMTASVSVQIQKAVYPTAEQISIVGDVRLVYGTPSVYNVEFSVSGITGHMTAAWSLTGDLASKARITTYDDMSCTVELTDNSSMYVGGDISLTYTKTNVGGTIGPVTKWVEYADPDVVVTRGTNPYLMDVMSENLLSANQDYMLASEAAAVLPSDFNSGTSYSTSIFYQNSDFRQYASSFDELKYFTRVTTIPAYCFSYCYGLRSVDLTNVVSIGNNAFYPSNLQEIDFKNVAVIGNSAFFSTPLEGELDLSNVITLGSSAFSNCSHITSVILRSCTSIPNMAFYNCTALESVVPGIATSIGQRAFGLCKLSSFDFTNITSLDYGVFDGCMYLTNVDLQHVTSISGNPFSYSYGNYLEYITVSADNTVYYSNGSNCVIRRSDNAVVVGSKNSIIPSSAAIIGNYAFFKSKITSVDLLQVTEVQQSGFASASLTSVVIDSVQTLGDSAFQVCTDLLQLTMKVVTSIGSYACVGINTVICEMLTPPACGSYAFNNVSHIYVPASVVNDYKAASGFSSYANIIEAIPE